MLNIVIPMAGKSVFFEDKAFRFPKPLIEIEGRPMLERVLANLKTIAAEKRFIFMLNRDDVLHYHLDDVIRLLTDSSSIIVVQKGETHGAPCSALLAMEHFNSSDPMIICNADSIIEHDLNKVLRTFESQNADAGTICFDSVHPQWSYVLSDEDGWVAEAAEKRPISTNAIAGFYYFRRGSDFVTAAFNCIEKEASVNGRYFTSLTFNELILMGKKILMFKIPNNEYHSFYSPERIRLYEKQLSDQSSSTR